MIGVKILAISATYNLSGILSFYSGESTARITTISSGIDNPLIINQTSDCSSLGRCAVINIGTSSNLGMKLTFYFD